MKISKYAYMYKLSNEKYVFHSALSGAIFILNSEEFSMFNQMALSSDYSGELGMFLKKSLVVLEDSFNEKRYIEQIYTSHKYQNYSLTVVPTMSCNFACTYCSQQDPILRKLYTGNMRMDVLEKLEEIISRDGGPRGVCFYGGEPLLQENTVLRVLARISHQHS